MNARQGEAAGRGPQAASGSERSPASVPHSVPDAIIGSARHVQSAALSRAVRNILHQYADQIAYTTPLCAEFAAEVQLERRLAREPTSREEQRLVSLAVVDFRRLNAGDRSALARLQNLSHAQPFLKARFANALRNTPHGAGLLGFIDQLRSLKRPLPRLRVEIDCDGAGHPIDVRIERLQQPRHNAIPRRSLTPFLAGLRAAGVRQSDQERLIEHLANVAFETARSWLKAVKP